MCLKCCAPVLGKMLALGTGPTRNELLVSRGADSAPVLGKGQRCRDPQLPRAGSDPTHGGNGCPEDALVFCDEGHPMFAKITREVFDIIRPDKFAESRLGGKKRTCYKCQNDIAKYDGVYRCKECRINLCMHCANAQLKKRALGSSPEAEDREDNLRSAEETDFLVSGRPSWLGGMRQGDILLSGPWVAIHHVILVIEQPYVDPKAASTLKVPDGAEIFVCRTVESSPVLSGKRTPLESQWYPSTSFFFRQIKTGKLTYVGTRALGSESISPPAGGERVMKLLFHPFRAHGPGGSFDDSAFAEAVRSCVEESKRYSLRTCLRAFIGRRKYINANDYPDAKSRAKLLEEIHRRWDHAPICVSVAIQVWQKYFELVHRDEGPLATDLAAQDIVRWMPCWSDNCTTSWLVKVLTKRGWVLQEDVAF